MYLLTYWLELNIFAKAWTLIPVFLVIAARIFASRCKRSQVLFHYTKNIPDLESIKKSRKIEGRTQGRVFASHHDTKVLGDFESGGTPGKITFTKKSVKLFRPIASHSCLLLSLLSPWDNLKMFTRQWVTIKKGDLQISYNTISKTEISVTSFKIISPSKYVVFLSRIRSAGVFFINLLFLSFFELPLIIFLIAQYQLNLYYWLVFPLIAFAVLAIAFYIKQWKFNSIARNKVV